MTTSKFVISVLASAIILFVWNAFSWMVLPFHSNTLHNFPEQSVDFDAMKDKMPEDGVYHYPGLPADDSPESWEEIQNMVKTGPRITMMVYRSGETDLFSLRTFTLFFCSNLITAFLLITVLIKLKSKTTMNIILTSVAVGLIICFASIIPHTLWYLYPLDYILTEMLDAIASFLLTGIFLSRFTFRSQGN